MRGKLAEEKERTYSQRGDDYLIEARRLCAEDKPKPSVVCPYCGHKMVYQYAYGDHFFCCPKCRAVASDKAEKPAYTAAMQRWQTLDRPLIIEEVREHCKRGVDAAPLWVEFHNVPSVSRWMVAYNPEGVFVTDMVQYYLASFDDGYNRMWRCWLRKPTQEEMEGTPWETK